MISPSRSSLLETLVERLAGLPSIGRKSAQRLAYHILGSSMEEVEALSRALVEARRGVKPCSECGNHAEADLCAVCSSPRRDKAVVCVVERPADITAFERIGSYRGVYHVLGGVLSPLDGIGPSELNLASLFDRCGRGVTEVILALGTHAEGEATSSYIVQRLQNRPLKVTRLARGLPAGSDLEFVDEITMQRALDGRVNLAG
ncbi:MAG TPA: recombination protein RecR [Fibrobacteres bacterium]|jgi:recombination protein RecR|nr:recombination protein RecR [Fibrobacterota bacterium]